MRFASLWAGAVALGVLAGGSACSPLASRPTAAPVEAPAAIPRQGRWVDAGEARIYYEICGRGPAIVFVHGLGGNHAVWFQQVAHFARDHTVIALSQRGFAPSGGDRNRYDVAALVDDLGKVLDDAGVAHAVVVGQSMGGWTALGFALAQPARTDALVLADTFGGISDAELDRHLAQMTAAAARLGVGPPPLGVHPALSPAFSARNPALAYLYQTLSTFGSPRPEVIAAQLASSRSDPDALGRLRVPTLFVVGSDDRLFPPLLVERAASRIAGSTVVRIDGAGHSPYFEKAEDWNAAVERFLSGR